MFDATVAGRPAVVKVDAVRGRSAGEAVALRAAQAHGIPVPEVHLHLDGEPSVLVLGKIDGCPLAAEHPASAWREAGLVMRRIHGLPLDRESLNGAGSSAAANSDAAPPQRTLREGMLDWTESEMLRSRQTRVLSGADRRMLRDYLTPIWENLPEVPRCLVHGDAQADHILVNADGHIAGVLDFGDVHVGDPVYDLAVLTIDHPGRLPAVLAGYRPARAVRARVETFIGPYQVLRRVAAANWMCGNGLDPVRHLVALRRGVLAEPRVIRL